MEKNSSNKLFIPTDIRPEKEIFKNFTRKALIRAFILGIASAIIVALVHLIFRNQSITLVTLLLLGAITYMVSIEMDGLSLIDIVIDLYRFSKVQKHYEFELNDEYFHEKELL